MMKTVYILFIGLCFLACSPISNRNVTRSLRETEKKFKDHSGLVVYDLKKKEVIFDHNGDRYFTPASNTKILTLYTALEILGDSVPALRYIENVDSIIIWGTGDPSFLNPICYNNSRVYDFLLNQSKPVYFSNANFYTEHFGPGWAWDDYNDNYSQERSALPVYGNSFQLLPLPDQLLIIPAFFKRFMTTGNPKREVDVVREVSTNSFIYSPGISKKFKDFTIPFKTDPLLLRELLMDTLHKNIRLINRQLTPLAKTLYSVPVDSLYKVMMQKSDNHIAEQLLLICAGVLSDSLRPEIPIRFMQNRFFSKWGDKLVWKDGSGLSRYNLITPRTVLNVWQKIYEKIPEERLFPMLATGGRQGTLEKWFKDDQPYVFGKTGTLSNNHSLSGFLRTRKGKLLIFAFMNTNYVDPVNNIRNYMQDILNLYYENY